MSSIIKISKMSRVYESGDEETLANNNINLKIKQGEFVVILGPSGSGKSTLLNILGGIDRPSSGKVIVDGNDIVQYNNKELTDYRARQIGFVFQFYNLIPTLTVNENVKIIGSLAEEPLESIEVLNEVGLSSHYNKFPSEISGGEQQRVSIARALAKNPKILLCDEPTGALDSKTGVQVLQVLKDQASNKNKTVLVVTHNNQIAEIADRVIHIKNGKVIDNAKNNSPKSITEVVW